MSKTLLQVILRMTAVVALLVASASPAYAGKDPEDSYKFDIGAWLGMSGYLGDANQSNLYSHPGLAAALQGRYLFNERTAIRAQLTMLSLSGNTADMTNVLPMGKNYEFKSWATSLDFRGEFNFLPYGMGETYRRLRRVSPYLALGLGLTLSGSDGKTFAAFSIPMSAGVKYKPSKRVNLMAEFTMRKIFGDHLDSEELADLTTIKSSFAKNTDWSSAITIGITYEFGPRCVVCNRID
ncbi:MAG: porin family protein [Paramuribaculum sp.]|nr:porin family protein [Paramuribaculum sp.]